MRLRTRAYINLFTDIVRKNDIGFLPSSKVPISLNILHSMVIAGCGLSHHLLHDLEHEVAPLTYNVAG
jgi:hypothetical protein